MKTALEIVLFLPLLGAVLNLVIGNRLPRRMGEYLACGAIWGSFLGALGAAAFYTAPVSVEIAGWLSDFDLKASFTLYLDQLSLCLILMITFVCGLIHVYSVPYMANEPSSVRYFALLNLFVAAMLLLVLAENLPLLYMGWEGVGFCSYALIGFWYREEKNVNAGRKAFIVTRIGDVALGVAIVWMFQLFGTFSIPELNGMGFLMPVGVISAVGSLLLIGAMGKSAQLPLMVWLPDAMAGPTPVSAQIHAATMVTAGVYLLMRMFPLIVLSDTILSAIAVTGCATAFYGASCALAQRDLKRVLAYSTISQIGFMMLGVGAGAITAATYHLLIHAFFKALLFLGAGCVITAMHHEQDIYRMGGLKKNLPMTYWLFVAGSLCLAGFPLTGGFFSKDAILGAVWNHGGLLYRSLYLFGLVTAFLTAFYIFRTVRLVFGGNGPIPRKFSPVMEWLLCPLALLALFGGLLNLPHYLGGGYLDAFMAPVSGILHDGTSASGEILLQGVAALISLGGILLAGYWYGDERRTLRMTESEAPESGMSAFLGHGWYFDRLYGFLFVRPFVRISGFLWEIVDTLFIDRSLDRFAALLGRWGLFLSRWSSGRVSLYLLSMVAGGALILGWMAWLSLQGGRP